MSRFLILVFLVPALSATAATRYVNIHSATPQPPYITKDTAARYIARAVAASSDGDTILVSTGTYTLAAQVALNKSVLLRGVGRREDTVVDGAGKTRCFLLDNAGARLEGFTITRGRASDGAGVFNKGGTVMNCVIVSNNAVGLRANGGGIYSESGLIKDCYILYNTAVSTNPIGSDRFAIGAGLYGENVTVEDSWIAFNSGTGNYVNGGGAFLNGGGMTYCSIMNNTATALLYAQGGGVNATMGTVLERCWISGNVADANEVYAYSTASADGGGLYIGNGTEARNCLIVENKAQSAWGFPSGGGVWISGSTLFHCTISGNQSVGSHNPSTGGGVTWGYSCVCQGTIIWANTAGSGNHHYVSTSDEVDFSYTCTDSLPPGTGNQNGDPHLFNPAFSNYRLRLDSPCLDAAKPATPYTVDLDGYRRPLDGDTNGTAIADIGCYEFGDIVGLPVCDFDGDGRTDPAVMRAVNGRLRLFYSGNLRIGNFTVGAASWLPAPADYDGDGRTDPAWFDPATRQWHIYESGNAGVERTPLPRFGAAADLPMPADFDGDGKADLVVRQAVDGKLRGRHSSDATAWTSAAGNTAWIAIPADYDGDGKADPAWYLPSVPAKWRIFESSHTNALRVPLPTAPGGLNDRPIAGDFDGDGKTDLAVFLTGTGKFRVKESGTGRVWTSVAGNPAWKPAPGDYNGDGLADCGWFNPATGRFIVLFSDTNNSDNTLDSLKTLPALGAAAGDRPVAYQPGK